MLYVSHVHCASSSIQTLQLDSFLLQSDSAKVPSLCQVKHDSLIFSAHPIKSTDTSASSSNTSGPITSLKLNSRILSIQSIPSNLRNEQQDLLILTDHHNPRLLRIRAQAVTSTISTSNRRFTTWQFQTISTLRIEHLARSPAESALELVVEPISSISAPRVAVSHTHSGVLNVLPLSQAGEGTAFSLR